MIRRPPAGLLAALPLLLWAAQPARAQPIDLSHGGPVDITADRGLEYDQSHMTVTATGNARAVRGEVTVLADQLVAHLRRKDATGPAAKPPAQPAAPADAAGGNEIERLEAIGHVRLSTPTDLLDGADHGVYDIPQSVLVLTGPHLRLRTPQQTMTARDAMEYWAARHMAVGRGNAVITTADGRQVSGDVLVGYTTDPAAQPGPKSPPRQANAAGPAGMTGKLRRAEAFGHVTVRTATEMVTGDRLVYEPDPGIARVAGDVRITRGPNQLQGAEAVVNIKTGISRLLERPGARVRGLVMPESGEKAGDKNGDKNGGPGAAPGRLR